ncbi:MAG TPA: FAD-binding oxidoreductase [Ornithinimicrobium sp.]|uniref:FAD-binding oxidoreductase n=1 Tax=Ornithinimicrobium sp. TaxID=1977084 RepID=UPI002B4AABAE|nr:FAD-binding oxidoreductase [Ornithinimicrobium sp.]HKJ12240.1 FAD-binding oxidoreductase [Ornithinimicrobium sp.]
MSLIVSRPPRRRARFHELRVTDVERLTDRSVALTFDVPEALRSEFEFAPGQYLTLRAVIDGAEVRRSYSICSSRGAYARTGRLRVASARVRGGAMSNWLNDQVRVGQAVQVMTPMGGFTVPTEPERARHHVAVAAGSGITPVLSLVTTALEEEPQSQVTVIFGNKRADSTMFAEELRGLENLYPARLTLAMILSQDKPEIALFAGRIDRPRMTALLEHLVPVRSVDEWYLCGPHPMVHQVQQTLAEHGADPAHVHHEIFHVEDVTTAATPVLEPAAEAEGRGGNGQAVSVDDEA